MFDLDETSIPCKVCGTPIFIALMSDHRAEMYRENPTCGPCKDEHSRETARLTHHTPTPTH